MVATLAIAAKLHNWGVSMGHFDTICIDEAGQATEPEVMGVVAPLLNSRSGDRAGQLVMAGDPKQLGPIVHSSECETRGLALSFLERLMQLPPYARDIKRHGEGNRGHDPLLISKLVRNYRSHPVILELPNELFYDGDLIQAADRVMTHRLQNWEHLPVKGHPMFFHAIFGKDEREANSPSWFNKFEALQVMGVAGPIAADERDSATGRLPERLRCTDAIDLAFHYGAGREHFVSDTSPKRFAIGRRTCAAAS